VGSNPTPSANKIIIIKINQSLKPLCSSHIPHYDPHFITDTPGIYWNACARSERAFLGEGVPKPNCGVSLFEQINL
jgi:hypothetical protein